MTKSQLVRKLVEKFPDLKVRDLETLVEAFFETIIESLVRGERIEVRGFGSFSVKTREPKGGRNPKTGEAVAVPEKRTPRFTMGDELRNRVDAAWRKGEDSQTMHATAATGPEVSDGRELNGPPVS
jgi:integration host factor subunit beta